jgi:hypothetical protein
VHHTSHSTHPLTTTYTTKTTINNIPTYHHHSTTLHPTPGGKISVTTASTTVIPGKKTTYTYTGTSTSAGGKPTITRHTKTTFFMPQSVPVIPT